MNKNYVYSWKCEFCGLKVYSTSKAAKAAGWNYTHPAGKLHCIDCKPIKQPYTDPRGGLYNEFGYPVNCEALTQRHAGSSTPHVELI